MGGGSLDVLLVEPYYGGSHRSFLEGLRRHLPFRFDLLSLPPRDWKWRMRLGAPYLADRLRTSGRRYDRVLASSLLDVAAFRGLAPAWVREVPLLSYFHENQAAYPVQAEDPRDLHFALTNVTSILASDSVAFNSEYNRRSFIEELAPLLRLARDIDVGDLDARVRERSRVLPPPVEFSLIDDAPEPPCRERHPVILWAHRWEHDKDPETFFRAMYELDDRGLEFLLVVMGESFARVPEIFDEARRRLGGRVLHWGYVENRRDYAARLRHCDVAVSTARHEFFGMGIVEAVRAGCLPCLPNRLSYPELYPDRFLYGEGQQLANVLAELLPGAQNRDRKALRDLVAPYGWASLAGSYREWIEDPNRFPTNPG